MRIVCFAFLASLAVFDLSAHRVQAEEASSIPWRNDYTSRLTALALLQTLNADLLSHDSATLTLDRWCEAHRLASPARIVAERVRDEKMATEDVRRQLRVGPSEPVRYRHVRLHCGAHILSEADNWYVPARLTPDMNHQLEATDIAFGRAVQGLRFQRHTLSARLLWRPLPDGWETGPFGTPLSEQTLSPPQHVIEHHAILTLADGTPFSEVVETYTGEILAFPEPPRP
jgi:chorismate-pyruvate lyase